jgi:hypothetical protein
VGLHGGRGQVLGVQLFQLFHHGRQPQSDPGKGPTWARAGAGRDGVPGYLTVTFFPPQALRPSESGM